MSSMLPNSSRLFIFTLGLVLLGVGLWGPFGSLPGWIGALVMLTSLGWGRLHWARNMSGTDRVFRLFLGLMLIGFVLTDRMGPLAGWFGLAMLVTASIGRCPVYSLLGYRPPYARD
jgi:hypothetical protein